MEELLVLKHRVPFENEETTLEQVRAAMPGNEEMGIIARIFQALSDPTRCKIILALTRHELRVTDLAMVVGSSTSSVSHHLKGLRDIRLVKFRREGNTIFYSIDDNHVGNLFNEVIYHLDHVQNNLPDHHLPEE
ncbi:MAG: helix-turn-helix transcriptional regulator [Chloroflexi bacterium]|uniref:Helix-turn-helix transcriptional regulator n=1 Tax=Candidatus Chlorohelix allophototropha TaxID=3003348 RepID=A0A8T7LTK6_9CHLR|nr:helix-turn-helix transcriptional regulator [Chloroflexota bacterium]WJW67240.1 metalloregulator ArsR/SmtB family transcription factor [Chloroflexota bacterium L227-S17]